MIYLDNNATTRALDEVVEAMTPLLREAYGNPSSVHRFGQAARHRVEEARSAVAELVHAAPGEIVFTSGGTESINLALRGGAAARAGKRRIVTTAVEHSAVLRVAEDLEAQGYTVDYVGVDAEGRIDEAAWAERLGNDVAVASVMMANNETGVLFDAARLCAAAAERGIPVHVDAVQAAGKVEVDVGRIGASFVSLSAHKFHGPKGVGALYVRKRARLHPQIVGGRQERERRGGTENVPGIVGMGVAARAARGHLADMAGRVAGLRDRLERGVLARWPGAVVNGGGAPRVGNTTNLSFPGLEAEAILLVLSEAGVCASSGSACSSGSLEPSHVLKAMGVAEGAAHGAIRFSLSRFTTEEEIDEVVTRLPEWLRPLAALKG